MQIVEPAQQPDKAAFNEAFRIWGDDPGALTDRDLSQLATWPDYAERAYVMRAEAWHTDPKSQDRQQKRATAQREAERVRIEREHKAAEETSAQRKTVVPATPQPRKRYRMRTGVG